LQAGGWPLPALDFNQLENIYSSPAFHGARHLHNIVLTCVKNAERSAGFMAKQMSG